MCFFSFQCPSSVVQLEFLSQSQFGNRESDFQFDSDESLFVGNRRTALHEAGRLSGLERGRHWHRLCAFLQSRRIFRAQRRLHVPFQFVDSNFAMKTAPETSPAILGKK